MTNNNLTRERIEAAIDWVAEEKIVTDMQRHLKATRVQKVNKIATADVLKTILAALDAVRWRDVADKPENNQCVFVDCGCDSCWGFYDKRSDFVINPCNGDSYRLDTVDRWYAIPLPKRED